MAVIVLSDCLSIVAPTRVHVEGPINSEEGVCSFTTLRVLRLRIASDYRNENPVSVHGSQTRRSNMSMTMSMMMVLSLIDDDHERDHDKRAFRGCISIL